jgi:hypothetical protein
LRHQGLDDDYYFAACINGRSAVLGRINPARTQNEFSRFKSLPELIDRETGIREVQEILENIIAEAGYLIESRRPELAAQARAALRRYADEAPRQAE